MRLALYVPFFARQPGVVLQAHPAADDLPLSLYIYIGSMSGPLYFKSIVFLFFEGRDHWSISSSVGSQRGYFFF